MGFFSADTFILTAVVLFTSSSTGMPKGVALSHYNILSNYYQFSTIIDSHQQDLVLNVLPIFHSFGLVVGLLTLLFSGAKVFLYHNPSQYKLGSSFQFLTKKWEVIIVVTDDSQISKKSC